MGINHNSGNNRTYYAHASDLTPGDSFILPGSRHNEPPREVTVLSTSYVDRKWHIGQPYYAPIDLRLTDYTTAVVYLGEGYQLTSTDGRESAFIQARDIVKGDRIGYMGSIVLGIEPKRGGDLVITSSNEQEGEFAEHYKEAELIRVMLEA